MTASLLAVGAFTSAASASQASGAQSGCGGVQSEYPAHWRRHYRPPLAVGDSTMLLAMPNLSAEGFSVNAHGCRQYPEALSLMGRLAHARALPHLVLIALGADGAVSTDDVEETLRLLGRQRLLVLVTPRELGGGSGSDAQTVRDEGKRHPEQIRVLDWVAFSAGHPYWFQPDGLHLTFAGAAAFAGLLSRVLPLAPPVRLVRPPRCLALGPAAQTPLSGVRLLPSTGVLHPHRRSRRVQLTVTNGNAFAVSGSAALRDPTTTIAAVCITVPAGGHAMLTLTLDERALAEMRLRERYRVHVVLMLAGPGARSTISGAYTLE